MSSHFDFSDDEFEIEFENCRFPDALFSHEAHLRLAWIHITKYGEETAVQNMRRQIKSFAISIGQNGVYHETVTAASVIIISKIIQRELIDTFRQLLNMFPDLLRNFKGILSNHYSIDIFNSEIARISYIPPDKSTFDQL